MAHVIEEAKSGRSKCRGCNKAISKGELRFGERLPNPFADDGDMTLWFHIICAAMRRPESFSTMLGDEQLGDAAELTGLVDLGRAHHRLERIAGVERAPSSRARCRHCREMIEKTLWRVPLVFFEEGTFNSSGYVHLSCAKDYFGTTDILDRLAHFAKELSEEDLQEISDELSS